MNQRLLSVLVFALLVSGGASLVLYRLLAGRMPTQVKQATTKLPLAYRKLEPGALVRDNDVQWEDWAGAIPEGVIRKSEDIIGRGVVSPVMAHEPFVESRLAPKGGGAGLAALIPKGMRAVAVRVNEIVGVAGFVVPGMRVDVIISGSPPGGAPQGALTETLLQNVQVLSAGQNFQKDAEGKPVSVQVVNLLVTPEQAERLSLASTQTTIQLVLRNPLDDQTTKTPGADVAELFHGGAPSARPAGLTRGLYPKPFLVPPSASRASEPLTPAARMSLQFAQSHVVEVIQGAKRTEVELRARTQVRP